MIPVRKLLIALAVSTLLCPSVSYICAGRAVKSRCLSFFGAMKYSRVMAVCDPSDDNIVPPRQALFYEDSDDPESSTLLESEVCDYCILTALATENIALGNYHVAVNLAKEATATAEHTSERNNIYAANANEICGDGLYAVGSFKESADRYKKALKSYQATYHSDRDPKALKLLGATHLLAHNLLTQNNYQEASEAWTRALGMTVKLLGEHNVNVAGCMANLAISHIRLGDYGPAPEGLLRRALHIYREQRDGTFDSESDGHPDNLVLNNGGSPAATVYGELGNLYVKRGDNHQAAQNYRLVQELYAIGVVDDKQAADAIENLGVIRWNEGELDVAGKLLQNAVLIRQEAVLPEKLGSEAYFLLDSFHRHEKPPSRVSERWAKLNHDKEEAEWKSKNISY